MIVAKPFAKIAAYELQALGLPGVGLVEVDYAVSACGPDEAVRYAREAEASALSAILAPGAPELVR